MKSIFLIALLSTMLFSAQKQIILGCFSHESNAITTTKKLKNNIESDIKLNKLIEKHSLTLELKKIGDYHVVTVSSFDNYPILFLALSKLEKYSEGAYVLNNIIEPEVIVEKFTAPEETQEVIEEVVVEEKVIVKEKVTPEPTYEEPEIVEEIKIIEPQSSLSDYYLEIALGLILLLVMIGIIFFLSKKSSKEEE